MRLANNLLFYWHELFACRAALCRPRHPPPRALSSSQRKQGVWPGGSAVVGMSSLHATATSYSIRHFWVRAWRRCANQERRPARPDLLEGGKGLVPLRVALSPLQRFFGLAQRMGAQAAGFLFLLGADWSGALVRPGFAGPWRLVLSQMALSHIRWGRGRCARVMGAYCAACPQRLM